MFVFRIFWKFFFLGFSFSETKFRVEKKSSGRRFWTLFFFASSPTATLNVLKNLIKEDFYKKFFLPDHQISKKKDLMDVELASSIFFLHFGEPTGRERLPQSGWRVKFELVQNWTKLNSKKNPQNDLDAIFRSKWPQYWFWFEMTVRKDCPK